MVKSKITTTTPRLKALYKEKFVKELQAELKLSNIHQVPKLEKIVVSADGNIATTLLDND